MTSIQPIGTLGSVSSLLAAIPCQGNPYRNHRSDIYFPRVGKKRTKILIQHSKYFLDIITKI
jgi:hypothetical protein